MSIKQRIVHSGERCGVCPSVYLSFCFTAAATWPVYISAVCAGGRHTCFIDDLFMMFV